MTDERVEQQSSCFTVPNDLVPVEMSAQFVQQGEPLATSVDDAINTSPELDISYTPFSIWVAQDQRNVQVEELGDVPTEKEDVSCGRVGSVQSDEANNTSLALLAAPRVLHPLYGIWTFWYLEYERSKCWEEMQHEITDILTVEDFWRFYMAFKPPSSIKIGSDLSLFRKGIRPMWEDLSNIEGGRWKMSFYGKNKFDLDAVWLDICLLLIGEALENSDKVNGAVVNVRGKINHISVWTSKNITEEDLIPLGEKLRDTLRLQEFTLRFQLHKDLMAQQGPNVVDSFIV